MKSFKNTSKISAPAAGFFFSGEIFWLYFYPFNPFFVYSEEILYVESVVRSLKYMLTKVHL